MEYPASRGADGAAVFGRNVDLTDEDGPEGLKSHTHTGCPCRFSPNGIGRLRQKMADEG
jgi:hypothetical protein